MTARRRAGPACRVTLSTRLGPERTRQSRLWRELANDRYATATLGCVKAALLVIGLGLGLVFSPSMNTATLGVRSDDAGVASATVNSSQQIGGSIGTAFLNTIAIAAATSYASGKAASPSVKALAAVHGYTVAFWWAAGIFFVGAVLAGVLLRPGVAAPGAEAQPALA